MKRKWWLFDKNNVKKAFQYFILLQPHKSAKENAEQSMNDKHSSDNICTITKFYGKFTYKTGDFDIFI